MIKKKCISFFIILIVFSNFCIGQNIDWLKKIKGYAYGNPSIKVLKNGNVNILGMFQDTVCFDNIPTTTNGTKFYSAKYNNNGIVLSKIIIDLPPPNIRASGIDYEGNLYFAGSFSGSVLFDTITLNSIGQNDIYIEKTDSLGNIIWVKQFGTTGNDDIWAIYIDSLENIYFSPSFNNNYPVIKLDSNGNTIWNKQYNVNSNNMYFSSIGYDSLLNIYLTGGYIDTLIISDNIFYDTLYSNNAGDIFIIKLNYQGNIQWIKNSTHSLQNNYLNIYPDFMCVDNSGNAYIVGVFNDTISFDNNTLYFDTSSNYGNNYFLIKYSTQGNIIWVHNFASFNNAQLSGFTTDNNSLYISGTFYYYLKMDGIIYNATVGNENMYIAKYDNNTGTKIWLDHIQGEAEEPVFDVNKNGNIYLLGPVIDTVLSFCNNTYVSNFNFSSVYSQCDALFLAKYSNLPTNISDLITSNNKFIIYPNPCNEYINIEIKSEIKKKYNVVISNIYGKKLITTEINYDKKTINISNLTSGIYIINISNKTEQNIFKFIKLK